MTQCDDSAKRGHAGCHGGFRRTGGLSRSTGYVETPQSDGPLDSYLWVGVDLEQIVIDANRRLQVAAAGHHLCFRPLPAFMAAMKLGNRHSAETLHRVQLIKAQIGPLRAFRPD